MIVEVWGTEHCVFCKKAIELLVQKQADYSYIDMENYPMKFASLFPGAKTVPQIIVDGKWVGGYGDLAAMFAVGDLE